MKKKFVLCAMMFVLFAAALCLPNVFCGNLQNINSTFSQQNTSISQSAQQWTTFSESAQQKTAHSQSAQNNFAEADLSENLGEAQTRENDISETAQDENLVKVDFSFENHQQVVDGGVFQVQDPNILTSGNGFSIVSAYVPAGETFTVKAFVKKGYYIDFSKVFVQNNLNNSFWRVSNVNSFATSFENTGFALGVSFDVTAFETSAQNNIQILLQSTSYTVAFVDGTTMVATVENVQFNTNLDISQQNQENITLFSTKFENGKLNLATNLQQQVFVGYFTDVNGTGKQYVFSDGNTQQTQQNGQEDPQLLPNPFLETGYEINPVTGKYQLAHNAKLLPNGTVQIALYAHRYTRATKITFNIQPNLSARFNAQDFVQVTNSKDMWFSTDAPTQIWIAFDTNATFVAPEIDGYKFFRFVIKRQLESQVSTGAWLPDAISYLPETPWFANETEDYVNCVVTVEYFAKVGVVVLNGQADYVISQDFDGEKGALEAQAIVEQGFVDTTRPLNVVALPKFGYTFSFWQNVQNGRTWASEAILIDAVSKPTQLRLYLQGDPVVLDFSKYNFAHGKIMRVVFSTDAGTVAQHAIGSFDSDGNFVTQEQVVGYFGQKATLQLQVDTNYAVQWPQQEYMVYEGYRAGYHNFSFTLFSPENENNTIDILPFFENLKTSYYLYPTFNNPQTTPQTNTQNLKQIVWGATDENNGFAAVDVLFGGREIRNVTADKTAAVEFSILPHTRYEIKKIVVRHLNDNFDAQDYRLFENGKLTLSKQFLISNQFEGVVQIEIVLARQLWEELDLSQVSLSGNGTLNNRYAITSAQDLALMMQLCNSNAQNADGIRYRQCSYILTKNISLANRFWTLIGTQEQPFAGNFDFNGHTVSGIFTVLDQPSNYGIFGQLRSSAQIIINHFSGLYVAIIVICVLAIALLLLIMIIISKKKKAQRKQLALK